MLNLLAAVACSSSIALLFAFSETRSLNRYGVTTVNYAAAAGVGVFAAYRAGVFTPDGWSPARFIDQLPGVLTGREAFDPSAAPFWALLVGFVTGGLFVAAFLLYQASVRRNGPSLSGMFGKLGILLPVLLSLLIWREFPLPREWVGIVLAVGALVLPSRSSGTDRRGGRSSLLLLFLFFAMGLAEFSNKLFQAWAADGYASLFLAALFLTAFLVSLGLLLAGRHSFGLAELLLGLAVGIPNLLSSWFLIRALGEVKAAVAFPFYSVGGMVLIALGGRLLFRERLRRSDYCGLGLAAAALVLLA